jgi:Peptidase family M1 domain
MTYRTVLTTFLPVGVALMVIAGCKSEQATEPADGQAAAQPADAPAQPANGQGAAQAAGTGAQPGAEQANARQPGAGGDNAPNRFRRRFAQAEEEPVGGREHPEALFAPLDLPTPNERRLASGAPGSEYWQQRVDYEIDASLDADSRRLSATMDVTYHNNSPDTLTYMWLQLDQNLYKPDSIGTLTRTGGVMSAMNEPFEGGFDIDTIRAGDQTLDWHVYDTLARVELPDPIGPGETFDFEVVFAFDMPPFLRRMGAEDVEQGTIFEYGQWFPNVCVYDDVYGWNTQPYLGTGEFYTNFGNYEVSVTVPREFLVAGSGELVNPEDVLTQEQISRLATARAGRETVLIRTADEVGDEASRPAGSGPLTWRFSAQNVRTFAFACSKAFIWDACGATVTDLDGTERTVLCQSMYPKEAQGWGPDADDGGSTQDVRHSIEFYSRWLYPYQWAQMTNVNGPEGGMEYPMMVFCGGRRGGAPFGTIDHEVGHSWFPMLVNSDERRHVWMDEGFNTFINLYSGADYRGQDPDPGYAHSQTMDASRSRRGQAIDTPPDMMIPRWLGRLGYRKTAMGLYLLREVVLGHERFDYAFFEYVHRWAFKSPQPADFYRTMEDASGMDLAWFWREWFLETGSLDQAVTGVNVEDDKATITIDNLREQVMPVTIQIAYADGTEERRKLPVEAWYYTDRRTIDVALNGRTITKVTVDPDEMLPDVDTDNNVWEPSSEDEGK